MHQRQSLKLQGSLRLQEQRRLHKCSVTHSVSWNVICTIKSLSRLTKYFHYMCKGNRLSSVSAPSILGPNRSKKNEKGFVWSQRLTQMFMDVPFNERTTGTCSQIRVLFLIWRTLLDILQWTEWLLKPPPPPPTPAAWRPVWGRRGDRGLQVYTWNTS